MDNETKISLQFNNGVNGTKKLEEYTKQLEKIYALTSALNSDKASKTLGEINSTIKATEKNTKDLKTKSKDLSKVFATAFSIGKVVAFGRAVQKVGQTLTKFVQASSSYIENVNLLEVAYKNANETIEKSSNRIETFIDKMADLYGLDESKLTRQFGVFKQMANAMQLPTETAEQLSEIMVKMTNDVASLYNLDLNRASNALQSALTGQTRPIRGATGADITEKTLQNTVEALNLDRNISQLSYVEKRLVMVISLTNQLKQSQGDYARTIESTANQFRILGEQWSRLTRSVGNVFYNLLGGILPYLNGILMALTEIFNLIASLMGFEMPEFDYSGLSGVSDVALDIEDALDGAGASADSLKNKLSGLRGFDKLNVISTPKSSGVSASAGVGGAIDPKILEEFNKAFADYDDMMGSVKMKARDIRDSIMHWLGFTEEINPLTGEVEWKYQGIQKTFDNLFKSLWDWFTNLSPLAQSFVEVFGIFLTGKLVKGISDVVKSLGESGLSGSFKLLGNMIKGAGLDPKHPFQGMMIGADVWNEQATAMEKFNTALVGASGIVVGLGLVKDGMEDISEKGLTLGNSLEVFAGGLSSVIGGAMAGASIGGGAGAVAGGLLGAFATLITALDGYKSEAEIKSEQIIKSLEPIKEFNKEIQKEFDNINEKYNKEDIKIGITEAYLEELKKITEANGNVKKGYEDRAKFITGELSKAYGIEIQIIDGVVQKMDEQISKIEEVIRNKKKEIALTKITERYALAVDQQSEAYANLADAQKKYDETGEAIAKKNDWLVQQWDSMTKSVQESYGSYDNYLNIMKRTNEYQALVKAQNEAKTALDGAKQSYDETQLAILEYDGVMEAVASHNEEMVDYWVNKTLSGHDKVTGSYSKLMDEAKQSYKTRLDLVKSRGQEINETVVAQANERYRENARILASEVRQVEDITPDYVEAWSKLAQHSSDIFLQYIDKLPEDVRKEVLNQMVSDTKNITPEMVEQFKQLADKDLDGFLSVMKDLPDELRSELLNKMYPAGQGISKELQDGLNSITPTVKVDADTSSATYKVNNLIKNMANMASDVFSGIGNLFKADGGIFYNGGWHNIAGYADGGLPPVGQMFVARENGAELVGTINNHTAVMNNDQIVDSVADGVYRAVVNANATTQQSRTSVTIPVQIGTKEIGRIVINDLQKMAKTNGKPIVIGG